MNAFLDALQAAGPGGRPRGQDGALRPVRRLVGSRCDRVSRRWHRAPPRRMAFRLGAGRPRRAGRVDRAAARAARGRRGRGEQSLRHDAARLRSAHRCLAIQWTEPVGADLSVDDRPPGGRRYRATRQECRRADDPVGLLRDHAGQVPLARRSFDRYRTKLETGGGIRRAAYLHRRKQHSENPDDRPLSRVRNKARLCRHRLGRRRSSRAFACPTRIAAPRRSSSRQGRAQHAAAGGRGGHRSRRSAISPASASTSRRSHSISVRSSRSGRAIYDALRKVGFGETVTYGELAKRAGATRSRRPRRMSASRWRAIRCR